MQTQPVTIVIPTYNRLQHLPRAILSCLRQNYPASEIIVVDNASTDGTREFMGWVTDRHRNVRYHRNAANEGAIANFDIASRLVKTEFFSFLSDDDLLLPSFLEHAMPVFERYPEIALSGLSCVYITGNGHYLGVDTESWKSFGYFDGDDALLKMTSGSHITWTTCVFKTKAFYDAGGINTSFDQCVDLSLLVRLTARYPVYIDQEVAGYFVRHKSSSCSNNEWMKLFRQINNIGVELHETNKNDPASLAATGNLQKYAKQVVIKKMVRDVLSGNMSATSEQVGQIASASGKKPFVMCLYMIGKCMALLPFFKKIDLPELTMRAHSFGKNISSGTRKAIERNYQNALAAGNQWLDEYEQQRELSRSQGGSATSLP